MVLRQSGWRRVYSFEMEVGVLEVNERLFFFQDIQLSLVFGYAVMQIYLSFFGFPEGCEEQPPHSKIKKIQNVEGLRDLANSTQMTSIHFSFLLTVSHLRKVSETNEQFATKKHTTTFKYFQCLEMHASFSYKKLPGGLPKPRSRSAKISFGRKTELGVLFVALASPFTMADRKAIQYFFSPNGVELGEEKQWGDVDRS